MKRFPLLAVFCLFVISLSFAQTVQYQEPQIIGSLQGLSNTKVSNIIQDKKGFIWIGTEDGLNKFDGYYFHVYKTIEGDSLSLINNNINKLLIDSEDRLWVGSITGLQYYNAQSDNFTTATLGQPDDVMKKSSFLWIMEDSRKNIWFSIQNHGVLRYSLVDRQSTLYKNTQDGGRLSSRSVRHIAEDGDGNIWLSSFDNGITVYNPKNNQFRHINTENSPIPTNSILRTAQAGNGTMLIVTLGAGIYTYNPMDNSLTNTGVSVTAFAVERLKDNSLIIGTEGEGLFTLKPANGKMQHHPAVPTQYSKITNSKIHCLLEDNNGDLWIGMYNEGIYHIKREPHGFVHYKKDDDNPNSLSYGQITGVTTDKEGNVWFATDGGGLNVVEKSTGKYHFYRHRPNDPGSLTDDAVVSVFCDSDNNIWAGTYLGGLCRLDRKTGKFTSYKHSKTKNSLPGNYVKAIIEDRHKNLWLGTDGNGISYFDTKTGTFENYSSSDYEGLVLDNITCLYLQDDKTLWVGTHAGISKLDIAKKEFSNYSHHPFMASLTVYSIAQDGDSNLWLGTSSGLYKYNPQEDRFSNNKISDRFSTVVINGVIPYHDKLWLSTNEGILCYRPEGNEIKAFINNNDLGGINFIRSSYYISPENEIFLGGGSGCYAFFPDKLKLDEYHPEVYITGLEIFNEPVYTGQSYKGRVILRESIDHTKQLTLKYSENSFTLRFSSPAILYPASVSYSCFLEGFDKQWIPFSSSHPDVTYANLSPGKYIFYIYASNIPGQAPDNVTTLNIEILPPLWLTWWAKVGYALAILMLSAIVFWIIYVRMRDKNELRMERLRAREQEELNQNKMQFFTNISHEFRSPLTLIISPLKEMQESETDPGRSHLMKVMLRNANRLLSLINQILDLRNAETNEMKLKAQPMNLVLFAQDFLGLFANIVHQKHISLSYEYNYKDIEVWYDPDLLEKCMYNLLFNACKFTSEGGKIHVKIERQSDCILLSVNDTGRGIGQDELPRIFDRFYQDELSRKSGAGSGIGLHLVNTIVKMHHGSIGVESKEGAGSCFTIRILPGKDHFSQGEYDETLWTPSEIDKIVLDDANIPVYVKKDADEKLIPAKNEKKDTSAKPQILLVEDDGDMRAYIRHELADEFGIEEATNGREALDLLKSVRPDLIVSDVMMPELNGIEFTRLVKENMDTCHIPVILLTANSNIEQKLEGLETGADSYIVKPFDTSYLRIRIRKLLETREKMREKFGRLLNLEAQEVEIENADDILLQNSINYIRDNISEPDLSVEDMAKHLHTSRTNLHRKIKTMTGSSPIELVKTIRMKQAAYLLEKGSLTVSEVAYEVGYNSLSYFSSSFASYWGISPSAYVKSLHEGLK